jgi:flagellar basal body-associated protein FliL
MIGLNNETSWSTLLIILVPSIISAVIFIILLALTTCAIKRMCVTKNTSEEDRNQKPTCEEYHEEIPMEGNAAYGHWPHHK